MSSVILIAVRPQNILFRLLTHLLWPSFLVSSFARASDEVVAPPNLPAKSSSEYFSNNPKERVLVPINIWGEVKEPGLHYVPLGSTVLQSLSLAGGPTLNAGLPDIRIVKPTGVEEKLNVFKLGGTRKVVANDTIQVDFSSFRINMPIILGIGSLTIGIVTLGVLLLR